MILRKLQYLFYIYKYKVYSLIIVVITITYFLFKWKLFCSNFQAWQHADEMCKNYERQTIVGPLCGPICFNRDTKLFKCHTFSATKEAVFSVELQNGHFIFKSAPNDVRSLHWYDNGILKYPTEEGFLSSLRGVVKNRLNVSVPKNVLSRLAHLHPSEKQTSMERQMEMDAIWVLVQDNEYLLSILYSEKDIFPEILGTCGSFFAVEYVEPLQDASSMLSHTDNKDNWVKRLRTSIQILEVLEEFEATFNEALYLCDIRINHFGIVKITNKLKIIDVDGVFPVSIIKSIFSNVISCKTDEDCRVYDCRSKCLEHNNKCERDILNTNLQIICEKIFLGWRLSNTVIIPGLLMSQHTPSDLASVLRQCANLKKDLHTRSDMEEFREKLVNILTEIEQSVNDDLYR